MEQRTVSNIVEVGMCYDLHSHEHHICDLPSDISANYQGSPMEPHKSHTRYTSYQEDHLKTCVGIEPHQRTVKRSDGVVNTNNHNVRCSRNKLMFGPENFDLFNFTEHTAPSVVNLSSHILTPAQNSLLEKGLNFCPTPGEPDMLELIKDMDLLHRLLILKAFFMKDKMKKSEINDARKAFMDFKDSSDLSQSKKRGPPAVGQKSKPSPESLDSSPINTRKSISTPDLISELELDLEVDRTCEKGFEHRKF